MERLIGTNRVQLLPGLGLRGADFIGMRIGVGVCGKLVGGGSRKESCEEISRLLCSCDGLDLRSCHNLGAALQHVEIISGWRKEAERKDDKVTGKK